MANFLSIDLAAIEGVLTSLKALQDDLDIQKGKISSLDASLDAAVQGDAVATFRANFDKWVNSLSAIDGEIDLAYAALRTLATAAEAGTAALNGIA